VGLQINGLKCDGCTPEGLHVLARASNLGTISASLEGSGIPLNPVSRYPAAGPSGCIVTSSDLDGNRFLRCP
jgi:hypothetical protein